MPASTEFLNRIKRSIGHLGNVESIGNVVQNEPLKLLDYNQKHENVHLFILVRI